MSAPRLPSPLFVLLTPDKHDGLREERLPAIFRAIESGQWKLDPNEIHPETGLTLFQAVARSPALFDDVRNRLLEFMSSHGADMEAVDPDGLTAWAWAMKSQNLDLAQCLEACGAKVQPGRLNAAQAEVLQELGRTKESWSVLAMVEKAHRPEVFGTLDAKVRGMPLGLHIAARHLRINFADLIGPNTQPPQRYAQISHLMKALATMGRRAMSLEPSSRFPVWCWMAQAQQMFNPESAASATRKGEWNSAWRRLEKAVLSQMAGRKDPIQAQAEIGRVVLEMGQEVIGDLVARWRKADSEKMGLASSARQQAARHVQHVAAYCMASLRSWACRVEEGEDRERVRAVRETAVFNLAAGLVQAIPQDLWRSPDFADFFRSAAYYSLAPGVFQFLGSGAQRPEWVGSPWAILPLLLPAEQQEHREFLEAWLLSTPSSEQERERALDMLSGNEPCQARIRQMILEGALAPAPAATRTQAPAPARQRF